MRILFLSQAPLIKYGLKSGFDQLGHETEYLEGNEYYAIWENPIDKHVDLIMKKINSFKPDFIFTEGYSQLPLHIIRLKTLSMGIPIFTWAIEDPVTLHIGDYLCNHSDHIFTTTLECLERYPKSSLLMFGVNPEYHKNYPSKAEYEYDLVLCASNYSNRYHRSKEFILPLIPEGFNIAFYGHWWDRTELPVSLKGHLDLYHGLLPYEQLPLMYSSAKIALGSQCDDSSFTQQSMRDFEVLGCGHSILLSYYTKAQECCFGKSGNYVYLAKNKDEMISMAKEILKLSDKARKDFAIRGQKYVYRNHNYRLKAQHILDIYNNL